MSLIKSIGRFARKAAPFAALIPGVGPLVAAGIGAGGAILEKGQKAKLLKDVVGSGAKAYGAGKLAGVGRAATTLPGSATGVAGGPSGGIMGALGGLPQQAAQASPSLLSRAGKFAGDNWKDILTGVGQYQQQRTANRSADRVEQLALARERRLRPLGDRALAMLEQSQLPELPDDLAIDASNPYAIRRAGRFR